MVARTQNQHLLVAEIAAVIWPQLILLCSCAGCLRPCGAADAGQLKVAHRVVVAGWQPHAAANDAHGSSACCVCAALSVQKPAAVPALAAETAAAAARPLPQVLRQALYLKGYPSPLQVPLSLESQSLPLMLQRLAGLQALLVPAADIVIRVCGTNPAQKLEQFRDLEEVIC